VSWLGGPGAKNSGGQHSDRVGIPLVAAVCRDPPISACARERSAQIEADARRTVVDRSQTRAAYRGYRTRFGRWHLMHCELVLALTDGNAVGGKGNAIKQAIKF
jgi:hypothetical protein